MSSATHDRQESGMPESDLNRLGPFEITGATTVRKLLQELARKNALIWLFVPDDGRTAHSSRLLDATDEDLSFALQTDDVTRESILDIGHCTVVGFLDNVKVQFDMPLAPRRKQDDATLLRGLLPQRLYRIQRRAAFRVKPPEDHPGCVVIRGQPGHEQAFPLFDMSATGMSFLRGIDAPAFKVSDRISLARLELGPRVPVPCTFVIRSVVRLTEEPPMERVGCEFVSLPSEVQRAIAVFVQDTERAMLRKRHE